MIVLPSNLNLIGSLKLRINFTTPIYLKLDIIVCVPIKTVTRMRMFTKIFGSSNTSLNSLSELFCGPLTRTKHIRERTGSSCQTYLITIFVICETLFRTVLEFYT